jgi:F-type H+-transporting ATPase subunit epsilon
MALELVVVTPSGEALSEEVEQVVLPGEAGEFGVLESHERFLTPLALGPMQIISSEGTRWGALSSGFAEVDGSRVVVLVDSCAMAADIDREASESRRVEVDAELAALADGDENNGERSRLEAALAQAELEVDVAGR